MISLCLLGCYMETNCINSDIVVGYYSQMPILLSSNSYWVTLYYSYSC